jgi:hypothetical protein
VTKTRGHIAPSDVLGVTASWERPLRSADKEAPGARAPTGPLLGAYVEDLGAKEALLSDNSTVYVTTPHFDGYPIVLVRLHLIEPDELEELITEAWVARAPKRLREQYLRSASSSCGRGDVP